MTCFDKRSIALVVGFAAAALGCASAFPPPITSENDRPVPHESGTGSGYRGMQVTPIPDRYRCGDEQFLVAFETGRAYVTLPDGSLVTLDRLEPSEPQAKRHFSDGRITFVLATEDRQSGVSFARGRMVPRPCEGPLPIG
jgi:hypothetical protein